MKNEMKKILFVINTMGYGGAERALLNLMSALEKNQYEIFWLFEVFRSPSYKAYERFDNGIMHDTDRNFVVWMKEGEYKFMELQSIESPQKEMDKMLSSKFNYLLPKEDF